MAITSPYFFLTSDSVQKYSALLIGCDLVKCRIMSDGSTQVDSFEVRCKRFLERYCSDHGVDGCSEATRGYFFLDTILGNRENPSKDKDRCPRDKRNHRDDYDRDSCRYGMAVLQIGKYANSGGTVTATTAIHNPNDPPNFNHKLGTAQCKPFNTISPELSKYVFGENQPAN